MSWTWALIPLVTVGLTTPIVIGFAALRKRSARQGWFALGYLGVLGLEVLCAAYPNVVTDALFWVCVLVTIPVAFVHALLIRTWAFDLQRNPDPETSMV